MLPLPGDAGYKLIRQQMLLLPPVMQDKYYPDSKFILTLVVRVFCYIERLYNLMANKLKQIDLES